MAPFIPRHYSSIAVTHSTSSHSHSISLSCSYRHLTHPYLARLSHIKHRLSTLTPVTALHVTFPTSGKCSVSVTLTTHSFTQRKPTCTHSLPFSHPASSSATQTTCNHQGRHGLLFPVVGQDSRTGKKRSKQELSSAISRTSCHSSRR